MLPEALLVIPIFVIFRQAGLIDTQPGLILADAAFVVPVGVWILKSFMDTIPREVREAALIDGCGADGHRSGGSRCPCPCPPSSRSA